MVLQIYKIPCRQTSACTISFVASVRAVLANWVLGYPLGQSGVLGYPTAHGD
jgi:hypothetical protein